MNNPTIAIGLVVLNGKNYIRQCLDSVLAQSIDYSLVEFNILDNGSSDGTIEIIEEFMSDINARGFFRLTFTKSEINLGMWGGQEELMKKSKAPFVVFLSVDVVLDKDFLAKAVETLENRPGVGAVQAKIYQYKLFDSISELKTKNNIIDTCGFLIERSRRIRNIGHGEKDEGGFGSRKEIFGVEGAVPIFRRSALESIRTEGKLADSDLFWYGEDLDIVWRLRLLGWNQIFEPEIIAWHDRGTTKSHAKGWWSYITRVSYRKQIPINRRRLGWRNTRWTRIKNDYIINILKDLPFIVIREVQELCYVILFEPKVLLEIPTFFRKLPRIIKKRRLIMATATASPSDIHSFFS